MDAIHLIIFFSVAIGLIVGIIGANILTYRNIDAILGISTADPEKDQYNFVVLCPLDELHKKRYLIVQVKETK